MYTILLMSKSIQKFSHTAVAVAKGTELLFSAFEDDGPMWSGQGPRVVRHKVKFPERFIQPPMVHVSVGMWDIESRANQRADISAEEVTNTEFYIFFRTWGDTRVARIRADWLAIGAIRHDDDFHL